MWQSLRRRITHWRAVIARSVWRFFVAVPFAALGTWALIRDEFLPPDWQSQFGILKLLSNVLPEWGWHWWAIVALVIAIFAVLEGSFREHRDATAQATADAELAALKREEIAAQREYTAELRQARYDRRAEPIREMIRGKAKRFAERAQRAKDEFLTIAFDKKIPGCREPAIFGNGSTGVFFRLKIMNNTGALQRKCRGTLVGIQRKNELGDFVDVGYAQRLALTWATHDPAGLPTEFDLPKSDDAYLDVFCCTTLGRVLICTKDFCYPNKSAPVFTEEGTYKLTVRVVSENSEAQNVHLIFAYEAASNAIEAKMAVA
jgi:hypothetical protein